MSVPDNPNLRDYFAAQALAVLLTQNLSDQRGLLYSESVAAACYLMADAMLAERAKATI